MRYCIYQGDTDFHIRKENFQEALKLLMSYAKKHIIGFGDNEGVINGCLKNDIESALSAARFSPEFEFFDSESDICGLQFNGEKSSNEEQTLARLAPVVENGSYITFAGEDECQWRYVFEDGKMERIQPRIIWPEPKREQAIRSDIEATKGLTSSLLDDRFHNTDAALEDTVLADILMNQAYIFDHYQEYEVPGRACKVFDCWEKASDKKAVESLFAIITGVRFDEFFKMCKTKANAINASVTNK